MTKWIVPSNSEPALVSSILAKLRAQPGSVIPFTDIEYNEFMHWTPMPEDKLDRALASLARIEAHLGLTKE